MIETTERGRIIAEEILRQLGGMKFIAMTGARHLLAGESDLKFQIPSGFALQGINVVKITLDPSDTYTIMFMRFRVRTGECKTIKQIDGVYADQLREIFTNETGLYCTL